MTENGTLIWNGDLCARYVNVTVGYICTVIRPTNRAYTLVLYTQAHIN